MDQSKTLKILEAMKTSPTKGGSASANWVRDHADDLRDALRRGWSAAALARLCEKESGGDLKATAVRPHIAALVRAPKKPKTTKKLTPAPKAPPAPPTAPAPAPPPHPMQAVADRVTQGLASMGARK